MKNDLTYLSEYGTRLLNKLKAVHAEHGAIIICYDFDDTVYDYTGKGFDYPYLVVNLIKRAKRYGNYTYVYTDLHKETTDILEAYLKENQIPYDSINKCPIELPFGNSGKPYYNILLDDKAGLGEALQVLTLFLDYLSEQDKKRAEAEALARMTPGKCNVCGGEGVLIVCNTGGMAGSNYIQAKVKCSNCSKHTKWHCKPFEDSINIDAAIVEWRKVIPNSDTK